MDILEVEEKVRKRWAELEKQRKIKGEFPLWVIEQLDMEFEDVEHADTIIEEIIASEYGG